MKLLVVGGTGRTGRRIAEAALAAGHQPLVLGRSASLFRALVASSQLRGAFADHAIADELVRASALRFTILRPPILVDGPPTGAPLRAGEALSTWSGSRVVTGDVAALAVAILDDPAYFGRCVTLCR